jgi:hypothetical protein
MKSKENLKAIDPALLHKILGGVQTGDGRDKKAAVIPQGDFAAFFHS